MLPLVSVLRSDLQFGGDVATQKHARLGPSIGRRKQVTTKHNVTPLPCNSAVPAEHPVKCFVPYTILHCSTAEAIQATRESEVCITSLRATADYKVCGKVNVHHISFVRKVTIWYTLDDWKTKEEKLASFSHRLPDTYDIEVFFFELHIPPGRRCEFCVSYEVTGGRFWDNNGGRNYILGRMEESDNYLMEMKLKTQTPAFVPRPLPCMRSTAVESSC